MTSTDRDEWFDANTFHWDDWTLDSLLAAKAGVKVSLVVPARNEAATVGDVVTRVREALVDTVALLDEIVVIDSDSTDDTFAVAQDAGADVYRSADIRPDLGSHPGKGEAMWKSLFVTRGDVIVFMDADLLDWDTHFVPGLLGPLLNRREVGLVKGFYERPFVSGDDTGWRFEGGRVTELVARPLIALLHPELSGLIQPLAGEWAIRRELFESLSVPTGYAVELAALVDTVAERGVSCDRPGRPRHAALTGTRRCVTSAGWRPRSWPPCGPAGSRRVSRHSTTLAPQPPEVDGGVDRLGARLETITLRQYHPVNGAVSPVDRVVETIERPPARSVGELPS